MPTLERYRRPHLILVEPCATADEVALKMAVHGVETVLVCDGQALVGIVTQRDLARRVVAPALDPKTIVARDIMSRNVVTLDVGAEIAQVAPLMRRHACRRIPITEDGCVVGLVTLDDLLVDGEFGQSVRLVIAAQLDAAAEEESRYAQLVTARAAPAGNGSSRNLDAKASVSRASAP